VPLSHEMNPSNLFVSGCRASIMYTSFELNPLFVILNSRLASRLASMMLSFLFANKLDLGGL
jgi:hypothetical protein